MSNQKIIRSLCLFTQKPDLSCVNKLGSLSEKLSTMGYGIQTQRLCSPGMDLFCVIGDLEDSLLYSIGTISLEEAKSNIDKLLGPHNVSFNIDLTSAQLNMAYVDFLFHIIEKNPSKCFNFTYVMNNRLSSPYFPSSAYETDGFSVGLQPTNLAMHCDSIASWKQAMRTAWGEINAVFSKEKDFLGIDSSIAPLLDGDGSFIYFLNRLGIHFSDSVVTPMYVELTKFLKAENPKPTGLCGLMVPCLEDFLLADEYAYGNFSIERNIYLSLHSGLGIDTYPIGIDEDKSSILKILQLLKALSLKYNKPLSARFVSDGKAKIGDKTNLGSPYLKDVVVRPL